MDQKLLTTKQHFEILDGLRGVAALGVVIFHFMEWVFTDINQNIIGHGFLAVDFFFCLSGFVIGYAYDNRLKQMGIKEFFKSRLIRLHPLVLLGSLLGVIAFLLDPFSAPIGYSAGKIVLILLFSVLLLPLPVMPERAFNLFSFNAPSWSLFWEYVANLVYALIFIRLSRKTIRILTLMAATGLILVSIKAGNLLGGWSKDNFWDGGARVAYSFLAGLLIYRSNWVIKNRLGFAGLALMLFLAFLMPGSKWNWLTETLVVLFYFPLLIALGAGSFLHPSLKKSCHLAGNLSYPLYMTHYSVMWIYGNYYTKFKPTSLELTCIIVAGILGVLCLSYLAMRYYDLPIRNYLHKRRTPTQVF